MIYMEMGHGGADLVHPLDLLVGGRVGLGAQRTDVLRDGIDFFIKEAGRFKQPVELPMPGPSIKRKKRHGSGRGTAMRYLKYLLKLHHKAKKKSRMTNIACRW